MWSATVKGLFAHKIRFALTSLAIVLGVAFVSGTLILTDTATQAFDQLFDDVFADIDVVVTSSTESADAEGSPAPFPASVLGEVETAPDVAAASGSVSSQGVIVTPAGETIKSEGGPPVLVGSWVIVPDLSQYSITTGAAPTGPGEAVVDVGISEDHDIEVGDRIEIGAARPIEPFEVVGIAKFDTEGELAGAPTAFLTLAEAQRMLDLGDQLQSIEIKVSDGTSSEAVRDELQRELGEAFDVQTGDQAATDISDTVREGLSFFTTFLLTFAGIALFVGAFIIVNTFSIVVTQRSRELALLRALGASRRQVLASVLGEALLVGVVASTVGLLAGIGFAALLKELIGAFGIDLPVGGNVIAVRTIVVAYVVGIGLTLVSSLLPARRASQVSPIEAMRESGTDAPRETSTRRAVAGAIVFCIGLGLLFTGLFVDVDSPIVYVGIGAVILLIGIAVLAPLVVRPIVRVLGAPLRGVTGTLGRQNATRNPRRTSSTAAALMIGLGLTVFVVIFNQSIKASADKQIDEAFRADLTIQADTGFGPPQVFAPAVMEQIGEVDGVELSRDLRGAIGQTTFGSPWEFRGEEETTLGAEFDGITELMRLDVREGAIDPDRPGLLVFDDKADDFGLSAGDEIEMQFPTETHTVEVQAIYGDDRLAGPFLLDLETYEAVYPDQADVFGLIKYADGADPDAVRAQIDRELEGYPALEALDQTQLKENASEQLNQVLGLVVVLLLLAVVISVIGIVNTLALSISERTREIGLLRAVGTTRGQLRAMVTWESVLVALLGAVLGVVLGIGLAFAITRALASLGLGEFVVPWGFVVIFFVLAGIAGVLAALFPARRALKIDVLDAVTTE